MNIKRLNGTVLNRWSADWGTIGIVSLWNEKNLLEGTGEPPTKCSRQPGEALDWQFCCSKSAC